MSTACLPIVDLLRDTSALLPMLATTDSARTVARESLKTTEAVIQLCAAFSEQYVALGDFNQALLEAGIKGMAAMNEMARRGKPITLSMGESERILKVIKHRQAQMILWLEAQKAFAK